MKTKLLLFAVPVFLATLLSNSQLEAQWIIDNFTNIEKSVNADTTTDEYSESDDVLETSFDLNLTNTGAKTAICALYYRVDGDAWTIVGQGFTVTGGQTKTITDIIGGTPGDPLPAAVDMDLRLLIKNGMGVVVSDEIIGTFTFTEDP